MGDRTEPAQIPDNLLKVVLHVWFTVPYRPNTLDNAFQYLTQLVEERPIYHSGAYIREVIVENIGADAFVLRLLEDTKREDASDPANIPDFGVMSVCELSCDMYVSRAVTDAIMHSLVWEIRPQERRKTGSKVS